MGNEQFVDETLDEEKIRYHLRDLDNALNKDADDHLLPEILTTDQTIVDIGCGVGQSFLVLECTDRKCIGVEVHGPSVEFGKEKFGDKITFYHTDASKIPEADSTVDLIYACVSIPYTNIPDVIAEMKRLLKVGGRVWMTLHSKEYAKEQLRIAIKHRRIIDFIHKIYLMMNGYLFKWFGFLIPWLNGDYESWQDADTMIKMLEKNGFNASKSIQKDHLVISGVLENK